MFDDIYDIIFIFRFIIYSWFKMTCFNSGMSYLYSFCLYTLYVILLGKGLLFVFI